MGKCELAFSEVSKHFTGVALEVTPTHEFKPADLRRKVRLRDLVGKIFGLKRALINILLLAVGLEPVALVTPLVTQWVVDGALVTGDKDLLLLTILGGGVLMVVQFFSVDGAGLDWLAHESAVLDSVHGEFVQPSAEAAARLFEKRHVGDIASRFGSLQAIRGVLTQDTVSAALDGVMAIITLAMMVLYSGKLAIVVMVALSLYLLLRWASFSAFRAANEEKIVLSAKENS